VQASVLHPCCCMCCMHQHLYVLQEVHVRFRRHLYKAGGQVSLRVRALSWGDDAVCMAHIELSEVISTVVHV
jgi:hypothetical protein